MLYQAFTEVTKPRRVVIYPANSAAQVTGHVSRQTSNDLLVPLT